MLPPGPAVRLLLALLIVTAAARGFAQAGGPYDLQWNTIDGGGTTSATGGSYELSGTIGQADAGRVAGGGFVVNGGFWQPLEAMSATATATSTMLPTLSAVPTATGTAVQSTTATKLPATPTVTVAGSPSPMPSPVPTALPTGTTPPTFNATPTSTSTPTVTATGTPTTVAGNTPTPIVTAAPSPGTSATAPPAPTSTPSPTPTLAGSRGDANCDGRVSAADTPALIRNVITGERAACGLDDVNGDTRVDSHDLQPLIDALFGEP